MSLMEQAIAAATDEKNEADKAAQAKTRERAKAAAEWFAITFGLDAKWVRSATDVTYQKRPNRYSSPSWEQQHQFRHRIKVDDVMFGLTYGLYGTDRNPTVEVVYITCPTCGDEHPATLPYVSSYGDDVERHQALLIGALGKVLTAHATCSRCEAKPCSECGRPF